MSTQPDTLGERARANAWLAWLGAHRDGFLVLGAMIYGLGYAVWAYYAWQEKLGLLPVLQFQYLVAGIPMMLGMLAVFSVMRGLGWLKRWVAADQPVWTSVVTWLWLGASAGLIATLFVFDAVVPRWTVYVGVILFALFSFIVKTPEVDGANQSSQPKNAAVAIYRLLAWWAYILGTCYAWAFVIILPVFGFFYFAEGVYPQIPQELGGAKPRCAYLDVDTSKLARETIQLLSPSAPNDPGIHRTPRLAILFSGDRFLTVRIGETTASPVELARDSIAAIHGCAP